MPSLYFKPTGEFLGENYDDVRELKEELYEYDGQWWHWLKKSYSKNFEYILQAEVEKKVPLPVLMAYTLLK